jgi:O-antigen ligase
MTRAVGPASIVVAALAVPLFYVPGADSPFADPKLALLFVAGGVGLGAGLLAWARGDTQAGSVPVRAALAAVVLTTVLAAIIAGVRRSPGAPYALAEIVRLLALIGVAAAAAQAVRDPTWRWRLFEAIHVAAGIVSLIGLLQHVQLQPLSLPVISVPGSTFGNRNMGGEAVAMALPFAFATVAQARRRGLRSGMAIGLLLAELAYLAVTRARGAWIGGGLGIVAFFLVRRPVFTRRAWLVLPVGAVVLAAAVLPGRWRARDANDAKRYAPGSRVVLDALDPASPVARTRLGLWRRTLAVYRDHPLSGVGPGNFGVMFPLHAEPSAAADGVMSATMVPRRPHNELLERLAETGPLGLAAFVALFIVAFRSAMTVAREARARGAADDAGGDLDAASAAAGAVAACLGCGLTAFPLAMPGTVLLFGVSLGAIDALAPARTGGVVTAAAAPAARSRAVRALAAPVAVILVLGAGWLSVGVLASSYWRGRARAALGRDGDARGANAVTALGLLERAARAPRLDQVRFDIALRASQVAVRLGRGEPGLQEADRALAIEPYSPHAWAARAGAQLALRNEAQAARDATRAMTLFLDLPSARTTLETVRKLEALRAEPAGGRGIELDVGIDANLGPVGEVGR